MAAEWAWSVSLVAPRRPSDHLQATVPRVPQLRRADCREYPIPRSMSSPRSTGVRSFLRAPGRGTGDGGPWRRLRARRVQSPLTASGGEAEADEEGEEHESAAGQERKRAPPIEHQTSPEGTHGPGKAGEALRDAQGRSRRLVRGIPARSGLDDRDGSSPSPSARSAERGHQQNQWGQRDEREPEGLRARSRQRSSPLRRPPRHPPTRPPWIRAATRSQVGEHVVVSAS